MKHLVLLLGVLLGLCSTSHCQQTSCTIDAYRENLTINGDTLRILNLLTLRDSTQLLTGIVNKIGSNASEGLILKLDNAGNVLWTRRITGFDQTQSIVLNLAQESTTGDYIIGGYIISTSNSQNGFYYLLSCTSSGTINWKMEYPVVASLGQSLFPYITSITEDQDGSLYIAGQITATIAPGVTGQYPIIIKTDSHGQLLFDKLYHAPDVNFTYFPRIFPTDNGVFVWGYGGDDNIPNLDTRRIFFFTLDKNGENFSPGSAICFSPYSGESNYQTFANYLKIFKTDAGYSVCGLITENGPSPRAIVNLSFDNTFQLQHSWYLPPISNVIVSSNGDFMVEKDGSLLFTQRSNATQSFVSKFDVDGSLISQRQFADFGPSLNRGPIYGGIRVDESPRGISLVSNYISSSGKLICEIARFLPNTNSNCFGSLTKFGAAQSLSTYTLPGTKLDALDNIVSQQNSAFAVTNPTPVVELLCSAQSICNSLTLRGNDTVCISAGQPSFYTAHRNQSCSTPVKWQFDTSGCSNFQKLNDSVLSITWKITVRATRTTQVIATLDNCSSLSDTVSVFITPFVGPFQNDTTICTGDSIRLSPGNWFKSYKWQDGSTDSILFAKLPGVYFVTYKTFCGRAFSDTVHIAGPDNNLLSNAPVSLCKGDSVIIKAKDGASDYQWTPDYFRKSISQQSILVFPPKDTTYIVFALLKTGCRVSDTTKVLVLDRAAVSISADDHLCGMVRLTTISDNDLSQIVWSGQSMNATTNSLQVKVSGRYQITAIDSNNCRVGDTLDVQVKACEPANNQIHFPNAFTPNQDGKNDIFKPFTTGTIISYELTVYNKLGQRIFISHDPYTGWDGKIAGKAQSSSAYVWICRYQFQGRQSEISKGSLLLVR